MKKTVIVLLYDIETGMYYTRQEFEEKFSSMTVGEKIARFYSCVKTVIKEEK
jgi:hypothetical protein